MIVSKEHHERAMEKRKAYMREYLKQYRRKHKARLAKQTADWVAVNRDRKAEVNALWYKKNRSRICAQWREETYPAKRDKFLKYQKEYAKRFPEVMRARSSRRRAAQKNLTPSGGVHSAYEELLIRDLHARARELEEETGVKWQVDHIVPLHAGGQHEYKNLQIIPRKINAMKGARILTNPIWGTEGFWESLEEAMV